VPWAFALTDNRARGVCGLVGPYSQFLVEPWRCERVELEASLAASGASHGATWWEVVGLPGRRAAGPPLVVSGRDVIFLLLESRCNAAVIGFVYCVLNDSNFFYLHLT